MDKFCSNCGKEINNEADFCLGCGKKLVKQKIKKSKSITPEMFGLFGLILGVISFYLSFILSLNLNTASNELSNILIDVEENTIIIKLAFAFGYQIIALLPGVISLVLSIISTKKEKNIYGLIGLTSSLIALTFIIVSTVFLIK